MARFLIGAVVLASVAGAYGDAVLPDLSGPGPWLGQSQMVSDYTGGGAASVMANIDWVVLPPGNYAGTGYANLAQAVFGSTTTNHYLYAYQIESNLQNLNKFSIQSGNMLSGGFVPNQNLDAYGWGDHNLPGESEPQNPGPMQNPAGSQLTNMNATWAFGPGMDAGRESTIMWYTSDLRPTYGSGTLADSIPPNPGHAMLPTPVPAPGAALLGLLGLAGLMLHRRV